MSDRLRASGRVAASAKPAASDVVVIWIDWYPYHVARFRGLERTPELAGRVAGLEMVGGVGVHAGLRFREPLPGDLAVTTLRPDADWKSVSKPRLSIQLWRTLTRLDPRVVLVPGYYTLPGIAAALWARLHGCTSVLMTESTEADHPRSGWRERAKSLLLRTLFDWAVCGGTAHRRYLARLGFAAQRTAGFYDVVDNDGIAAAVGSARAQDLTSGERAPYFLYVGRLAPEKNVTGLVRAWLRYRERGGTWRLVLAGDGPERGAIASLLEGSSFLRDVELTGLRTARELVPLYAAAGCFVLPSTREPWGLVVNEAMAAGLPVLVSCRCGAAIDLVREGENGYSFDPAAAADETSSLISRATSLTDLLGSVATLSPERRAGMGLRSAELVRVFSPQAFGREVARIYRESVGDVFSREHVRHGAKGPVPAIDGNHPSPLLTHARHPADGVLDEQRL